MGLTSRVAFGGSVQFATSRHHCAYFGNSRLQSHFIISLSRESTLRANFWISLQTIPHQHMNTLHLLTRSLTSS